MKNEDINIIVYNDGQLVHEGTLASFLADNGNDEWLTQECKQLSEKDQIEFNEFSGHWLIEKVKPGALEGKEKRLRTLAKLLNTNFSPEDKMLHIEIVPSSKTEEETSINAKQFISRLREASPKFPQINLEQ